MVRRSVLLVLLVLGASLPVKALATGFECLGDDTDRVWIPNTVTADGDPISNGGSVTPGSLLRGELHFCVEPVREGEYIPIIQFDPPAGRVNQPWNDHIKFKEVHLVADTDIWAATWFQFIPCEGANLTYKMNSKLRHPQDRMDPLLGARFSVTTNQMGCVYPNPPQPQNPRLIAGCDQTLETVWLEKQIFNADTGLEIDPTQPLPILSNITMVGTAPTSVDSRG